MEKTLKALMDYQKFAGNSDLQAVIDAAHSRYAVRELSPDEMEWVSAAGVPGDIYRRKADPDDGAQS